MNVPRAEVVKLLIPYILPFNLLKNGLNAAFVMLLYKPILNALRKANLIDNTSEIAKRHWGTIFVSVAIIATVILLTLAWQGII